MEFIHISFSKCYRFKGVTFEWHNYMGPVILNRHSEQERPWRNVSLRIYGLVRKFSRLDDAEKELYRIY